MAESHLPSSRGVAHAPSCQVVGVVVVSYPMPIWEYNVATSGLLPGEIENECELAGLEGWNLVSVIIVEAAIVLPDDPPGELKTRLIFKRKVRNRSRRKKKNGPKN